MSFGERVVTYVDNKVTLGTRTAYKPSMWIFSSSAVMPLCCDLPVQDGNLFLCWVDERTDEASTQFRRIF